MTCECTASTPTHTMIRLPPGFQILADGPTSLWVNTTIGLYLEISLETGNERQWRYTLEAAESHPRLPGRSAPPATTLWSDALAVILAYQFAHDLRTNLTDTAWREMRRKNVAIAPGCCASHDYLDANMVMDPAFTLVVGRPLDANNEDDTAIWNAAWGFATPNLLTEAPAQERQQ